MQYALIKDNFSRVAKPARAFFDNVYRDSRRTPKERFNWDYWNLRDGNGQSQYRHLRTPARQFLPKKLYDALCLELVRYGQSQFGCWSISDPWLSLYLDDCEQELHTDNPHGPWAYVLSLTTNTDLVGGATKIVKPEVLNYWQQMFSRKRGFEQNDLLDQIAPKFNRLVAFDPRLPHGVSRVRGAFDQLQGRLVLHGWFVNPEPYVTGGLEAKRVAREMPAALNENIGEALVGVDVPSNARGMLTYELSILASGRTSRVRFLTDSVATSLIGDSGAAIKLNRSIEKNLARARWPKAQSASKLVLPLVFD